MILIIAYVESNVNAYKYKFSALLVANLLLLQIFEENNSCKIKISINIKKDRRKTIEN